MWSARCGARHGLIYVILATWFTGRPLGVDGGVSLRLSSSEFSLFLIKLSSGLLLFCHDLDLEESGLQLPLDSRVQYGGLALLFQQKQETQTWNYSSQIKIMFFVSSCIRSGIKCNILQHIVIPDLVWVHPPPHCTLCVGDVQVDTKFAELNHTIQGILLTPCVQ